MSSPWYCLRLAEFSFVLCIVAHSFQSRVWSSLHILIKKLDTPESFCLYNKKNTSSTRLAPTDLANNNPTVQSPTTGYMYVCSSVHAVRRCRFGFKSLACIGLLLYIFFFLNSAVIYLVCVHERTLAVTLALPCDFALCMRSIGCCDRKATATQRRRARRLAPPSVTRRPCVLKQAKATVGIVPCVRVVHSVIIYGRGHYRLIGSALQCPYRPRRTYVHQPRDCCFRHRFLPVTWAAGDVRA
jgi:hypothetical protein